MPTLLMLQGLPGSGKTTLAQQLVDEKGWVRVNKDDIRAELEEGGWIWSREAEKKDVLKRRDDAITLALRSGKDVVSDDTNFGRSHKTTLEAIARAEGAEFDVQRLDVPVTECLERNSKREGKARVPDKVIWDMFNNNVKQNPQLWPNSVPKGNDFKFERVVFDGNLMRAIICDLDGTLSLFKEKGHRGPFEAEKCDEDDVNVAIRRLLRLYHDKEQYQIIYLSGREDKFRDKTMAFLTKHNCPEGPLYMRTTGDFRKDWIVKYELFNANVRGKYDVEFVLDDRNQVVDMWRKLGLQCWQVAEGNF